MVRSPLLISRASNGQSALLQTTSRVARPLCRPPFIDAPFLVGALVGLTSEAIGRARSSGIECPFPVINGPLSVRLVSLANGWRWPPSVRWRISELGQRRTTHSDFLQI